MLDSRCSKAAPQRRTFLVKEFKDYFSDSAIIGELCKERVKRAKRRNDALFWHRISSDRAKLDEDEFDGLFPPRRSWNRFRPRDRGQKGSLKINQETLKRAMLRLRNETPSATWVERLHR